MKAYRYLIGLIICLLLATAPRGAAYERYNDGCQSCHGSFLDGTSTKGSVFPSNNKHTMHRSSSYMATSCTLCHSSGDNDNPFIGSSDGTASIPGLGCVGCHNGPGLRKHHNANSVTDCSGCHNLGGETAPAENVNPPYYGTTGTKAKNPCNPVAAQYTNENWTVGAPYEGTDNDGNNLYDANDPACSGATCSYTLTPATTNYPASGGSSSLNLTTQTGCVWTAAPSVVWITLPSSTNGTGSATILYNVAVNATTSSRTGTVVVAGKTSTIIQAGGCSYNLSRTSTNFLAAGGAGTVAVTAGAGCAWTAASNAGWVIITSGASGTGNGSVGYSVAANTSSLSRTGTATIAGVTFTVAQAGVVCTYVLNPVAQAFVSGGGTGSFAVTAPVGCAWSATTGDAWLTINAGTGTGNGTVNFTVGANASSLTRTGTVAVSGQTFTVTQTGVACAFTVAPTNATYAAAGGAGTANVTAPGGCAWTAASNDGWISVTSGASGTGNGVVGYTVAANATAASRTGTVTIAGKTLTVAQAGTSCTFALNPVTQPFVASGGTGSFAVTTPGGCAWTGTTSTAWLAITVGVGTGNGAVNFTVGANASSASRTGTIAVAGQNFTVTQTGVGCTFAIAPTNSSAAATGGAGSVNVTAPGGCAWTAASNAGWITVTSGASGSGSGSVGYDVAANAGSTARTGTVTIAGLTLTVVQGGNACTYSLSPTNQVVVAGGGTGTFTVTATPGCAWTATTGDAWLAITSGSGTGNGAVNFTCAANPSSLSRTGTIVVAGQNFRVTQGGVPCAFVITPTNQNFSAIGGAGSLTVSAPGGCAWTASNAAPWVVITAGASGTGNGAVAFTVAANPNATTRQQNLVVAGQNFTVTQAGAACAFTVTPTNVPYSSLGGAGSVSVTAVGGCAWSAASNDAWLTVTSGASGSGNGSVGYTVAANASAVSRTGTLTVAGQTVTVPQAGTACAFVLTPGSQTFGENFGTATFNVTTADGCAWTASTSDGWLSLILSNGTGNGLVRYAVQANATALTRTGAVSVAGQNFAVIQTGVPCAFVVAPTNAAFAAAGGSGTVNVAAPSGCAWTATSNDAWLSVTVGSAGLGDGTVSFVAVENLSSVSRTGSLTVADDIIVVVQEGNVTTGQVDLDIVKFRATRNIKLAHEHGVRLRLDVRNKGLVNEPRLATVVGVQNGVEVYRQEFAVAVALKEKVRYELPEFMPTGVGDITWTATVVDDDVDLDSVTKVTRVKAEQGEDREIAAW